MGREQTGGTGPQQPSQAEGDRETVEQDLAEKQGGDDAETVGTGSRREATPAARSPEERPSQAEGERS